MSSYKNAAKARQKTHRERSQPSARTHLGILPKKKDYKRRAEDHHRKERQLTALKRKALDKNPDEFYFKMVRTKMEDGVHQTEDETPTYTDEQMLMMHSQDAKYVNYKRSSELKKISKLKSRLHMLDVADKPANKHKIFVDSKKEVSTFNAASHFDTHPSLLARAYNRPRMSTLRSQAIHGALDNMEELAEQRGKKYAELNKRIEREKQLKIIADKMNVKKHLMDKKAPQRKKIAEGTPTSAAVYQWPQQRKR